VFFRDTLGNESALAGVASDTVTLDATGPSGGSMTLTPSATPASRQATVAWSAFSDNAGGSGIVSYKFAYIKGTSYPSSSCKSGTVQTFAVSGASGSRSFNTALSGQHSVRLCPVDAMGNVGAGLTGRVTMP